MPPELDARLKRIETVLARLDSGEPRARASQDEEEPDDDQSGVHAAPPHSGIAAVVDRFLGPLDAAAPFPAARRDRGFDAAAFWRAAVALPHKPIEACCKWDAVVGCTPPRDTSVPLHDMKEFLTAINTLEAALASATQDAGRDPAQLLTDVGFAMCGLAFLRAKIGESVRLSAQNEFIRMKRPDLAIADLNQREQRAINPLSEVEVNRHTQRVLNLAKAQKYAAAAAPAAAKKKSGGNGGGGNKKGNNRSNNNNNNNNNARPNHSSSSGSDAKSSSAGGH
jgi:hypothetical protein